MINVKFGRYLFQLLLLTVLLGCKDAGKAGQNAKGHPDLKNYAYCLVDNSSSKSARISVFNDEKIVANLNVPGRGKKVIMLKYPGDYQVKKDDTDSENMNVDGDMVIAIAANGKMTVTTPPSVGATTKTPPPVSTTTTAQPPVSTIPTVPPPPPPPVITTAPPPVRVTTVPPPVITTTPPPPVNTPVRTFVLKDSSLNKPLANTLVTYVIVPSIGNEARMNDADFRAFGRENNNRIKAKRTDMQGNLMIDDLSSKNGDILAFALQNASDGSGYIKYQRLGVSSNNVEIAFSGFSNDPVRKNFNVKAIPATNYLTGEDLSAEFFYRLKGEQDDFEKIILSPDNIHIDRNSGYFTVTPGELKISLFSEIEYRLRLTGESNDGYEITVENKTPVSRQLNALNTDAVITLDQKD